MRYEKNYGKNLEIPSSIYTYVKSVDQSKCKSEENLYLLFGLVGLGHLWFK